MQNFQNLGGGAGFLKLQGGLQGRLIRDVEAVHVHGALHRRLLKVWSSAPSWCSVVLAIVAVLLKRLVPQSRPGRRGRGRGCRRDARALDSRDFDAASVAVADGRSATASLCGTGKSCSRRPRVPYYSLGIQSKVPI